MGNLIVVSPDRDLEIDYFADFQKHRRVRQNLFYTTEGAETFYTYRGEDLAQIRWEDEYDFFVHQPFWSKNVRIAFISLGCGNAGAEKMLLNHAHHNAYQVAYFGVDSSRAMLELAQQTLQESSFEKAFFLADFTKDAFRRKLHEYVDAFSTRIYAMLGGTFGNFDQQEITSLLRDLLNEGDYLYLDIVPRYASEDQNLHLRARLAQLHQNLHEFFVRLLEKLCIPVESGVLLSEEVPDEALDAWRYVFFFEATEPLTFPCFGGQMSLLPGERIELLNVRAYNPNALKAFLNQQGFVLVDEYIPDVGNLKHLWQRFLFKKHAQ